MLHACEDGKVSAMCTPSRNPFAVNKILRGHSELVREGEEWTMKALEDEIDDPKRQGRAGQ